MKTALQIKLLLIAAELRGLTFTTDQASGAWPNGSRIVKTAMGAGDGHQVGDLATVVGSLGPIPWEGRPVTYGYFVFWDKDPGSNVPVFIHDNRIALAPTS